LILAPADFGNDSGENSDKFSSLPTSIGKRWTGDIAIFDKIFEPKLTLVGFL
jgi:hypothetical protein